ncbi:MAG: phage terminase large subunit family protein, partial [Plesiomonas shigelloides]
REHQGDAWFLSGAYGKNNDFYRLFEQGSYDPEWSTWQFPSKANPHLSDKLKAEMASVTEMERRQRFEAEFLDVAVELSDSQRIIGADETFRDWCMRLEADGLKVDGHPFTLSNRPAMNFIYDLIPSNAAEAFGRIDVIMKCTQVGFTVMEMLAMLYLSIKFNPAKIGMFMPVRDLAAGKSSERFIPIVRTIPEVHKLMLTGEDGGKKGGEGNVLTRTIGGSIFHFLWTSGKASTESNPMDVVSFDEVQEMAIADMEKTRERMSASRIRYTLMGSTANWPDADIHWWYKKGTQHQFHTRCPHCGTGQVLDEHFPQCIGYDPDYPKRVQRPDTPTVYGEYRYRCHKCEGWIDDPQAGEWIPKNPDADIRSVHFPQFLSPTISPREMIEAYHNADDMKNYYNRKLGKPYTDPSQVPVNLEMLNECARVGMELGLQWKTRARGTFMGIDQMGQFNVAVLKERLPDGRQAVVHIEYIYSPDPFARCSELMNVYGVQCCVVEMLPNYNDAKRFANNHPGKVFLAGYGNMDGEMLAWGDTNKLDSSDRRTSDEERDRWTVRLDQYKCMQVSMKRFQNTACLFPDPTGLVQEVIEKGERKTLEVCKDLAFFHFTRTALIAEKDDEEKKYRRRVVKVGIDPHTSYANMLCDVAWARAHGTSTFILPDVSSSRPDAIKPQDIGVPNQLAAVMEEIQSVQYIGDVCGRCINYNSTTGLCNEIGMIVQPKDPGCMGFIAGD